VGKGKGKRESVWSREETEVRWAHTGGYHQGGEDVSRGNGARKGNNDESGRDMSTGEPGENDHLDTNFNREKRPTNNKTRRLSSSKRALKNDGNGDDITGAN
jgi:hypothetical protein